jgi:hypothetical protein
MCRRTHGGLRVHDGFDYFVHGWAEALAPILGVPMDRDTLTDGTEGQRFESSRAR